MSQRLFPPDPVRIAIDSTRTADIDDVSGLSVFDSEIWGGCPDKFKGGGVM